MTLEILAPAGNIDCAKVAIHNGANAIYLGYRAFSARQGAENFDDEGLSKIIKYAHFCSVKTYVAMNTVIKEEETDAFLQAVLFVWSLGADAIILQDALLGKAIHERYPKIVLHLSTQAGVCNENGAKFAKECGFSRVILARETPLAEIEKITRIIETEAFVQGALCTCFSGQCYFSSFIGGNSGNRGRCKQPCRKLYAYNRNGNEEKNYALSLSDLCVGEDIRKYIDAGVSSFKIEGRMRRAEYVGAATSYYRLLIDSINQFVPLQNKALALSNLKRTYNRGNYTKGLAFGQDKRFLSTSVQGHIGEKVGVVKVQNAKYLVESVFHPQAGDAFKILRNGREIGGVIFLKQEGKSFVIGSKIRLKNGDSVFITTDTQVNNRVLQAEKKGKIYVKLRFRENDFAYVEGEDVCMRSDERLQTASSHPLTVDEVKNCFKKTDGLPVEVIFDEVEIEGKIFIAKSTLNAFRRNFYTALAEKKAKKGNVVYSYEKSEVENRLQRNDKIAVIATDFTGVETDIAICKPNDYANSLPTSFVNGKFEKYVYYPPFVSAEDEKAIYRLIQETKADGVYIENYSGITFAQTHNLKIFAGTGLNISNATALSQLLTFSNVSYYAVSKELSTKERKSLLGNNAFALKNGGIKLMDLCYCPFGKTCNDCDKLATYTLTDENGRNFPVRRYKNAKGDCRFEVYNCAFLVGENNHGAGALLDLTLTQDKVSAIQAQDHLQRQKQLYGNYTLGHTDKGVL